MTCRSSLAGPRTEARTSPSDSRITSHPEKASLRNIGLYRLQKFDGSTLGMQIGSGTRAGPSITGRPRLGGQRLEAAALRSGWDPAVTCAADLRLCCRRSANWMLAGFLRRKPVEIVRCKTIDQRLPANRQIVLEGYVEPGERRREGPFWDHTGFYSLADDYPVKVSPDGHYGLQGTSWVHPTIIVGRSPQEDVFLAREGDGTRIFLPLIRTAFRRWWILSLPAEGTFHNFAIVSIRKRYPDTPAR